MRVGLIVRLHHPSRGVQPPCLLQDVPQIVLSDARQANQDGGITTVVVGDEEGLGIRLHPDITFVVAALDDERLPSSHNRARNLPRTRKPGVPYEEPSSTPGKASNRRRTVARVIREGRGM